MKKRRKFKSCPQLVCLKIVGMLVGVLGIGRGYSELFPPGYIPTVLPYSVTRCPYHKESVAAMVKVKRS